VCACIASISLIAMLMFVFAVACQLNLTGPEGYIDAPPQSTSALHSMYCSYVITVYMGYGVEVQVRATSINTAYVGLLILSSKLDVMNNSYLRNVQL